VVVRLQGEPSTQRINDGGPVSSHRQLRRRSLAAGRRLVDLIGPTSDAARQSLTALGFNSTSSFVAGLILASALGTFQRYPTLLTLVPAAIGLRGNVMGGMGNRLSTAIHTGTFSVSLRGGTVMGQNVSASLALSSVLSFALAVIASVVGRAFGLEGNINLGQLAMVSIVGGVVASVLVLIATVGLAVVGVRRNWDLDNLVAPSVSTLGDVITVPVLYLASLALAWPRVLTTTIGWVLAVASVVWFVVALRSRLPVLSQVCRESAPILVVAAGAVDDGRRGRHQAARCVRSGAYPVHPGAGVRVQRRSIGWHPQLPVGDQVALGPCRSPTWYPDPRSAATSSPSAPSASPSFSTTPSGPNCSGGSPARPVRAWFP
jgi:cation transporter-like permease